MIIGIDANEANLTSHRVGVNQYAFDLLHALYNLKNPHKFVIYVKTPPQEDLPQPRDNWQYRYLPFPKAWTQTRLPWDLFTHFPRPDVFFSATHYAPRFSPVPTVVAIMDLGFFQFSQQFTSKDSNQLKNWTSYSVRQATKLLAISEHTKKDVTKYFNRPAEDITVTYPGYDSELFVPTTSSKVLEKYKISKPYFLFLSSLKPSRNVEGLLNAFARFPNKEFSLVIAGKKGWLYDQIFSLVKSLKLENRVVFTGFIDEAEVPVLMTSAASFILPSFYEGFGIPVVEAMACGTPVVVSNVASLPEVAGDAGIYVNPESVDSILEGMKTSVGPQRDKFVSLGLKRVKLFDWDNCARQTLQVIESCYTQKI